jgi:hypothetical protein
VFQWIEVSTEGGEGGVAGVGRACCGRKGRAIEAGWGSSGSFALERRAQDDSKKQATARTGNDKDKYGDSGLRLRSGQNDEQERTHPTHRDENAHEWGTRVKQTTAGPSTA